ncbi:MAG: ABC transporter permease [Rhizobiales bacterium]|nr:ABC transporter permease [Hyphomicrobiales bacterium]
MSSQDIQKDRGYWYEAWREIRSDHIAMFGLALVVLLIVLAVFAPLLAPASPTMQSVDGLSDMGDPLPPGSPGFILGSDGLGRDVLSRVMYGASISLAVGVLANLIAAVLGTALGGMAGLIGGRLASWLMRVADVIVSFPVLLLAMAILSVLASPGVIAIAAVIGVNFSGYIARLVFGQVTLLREREFIVAVKAVGGGNLYILLRHILPHVLPSVIVFTTLGAATAIQLEAALSYVGLGIRPPTASWGNMISDGQAYLFTSPWLVLVPGAAIFISMIGFSLLGDGLRDALDPTLERRSIRTVMGMR